MNIDIAKIPFSMRGSYMAISDLPEHYFGAKNRKGIFLRTIRGGSPSTVAMELVPYANGEEIAYTLETTGLELIFHTECGDIRICYADEKTILCKASAGLSLKLVCVPPFPFFHYIHRVPARDQLRYLVNCFGQNVKYLVWTQEGETSISQNWLGCVSQEGELLLGSTAEDNGFLAVIREVVSEWDGAPIRYDYDQSLAHTAEQFEQFYRMMPSVPAAYEEAARVAAYVDWSAIVAKAGFLPCDTMYMSKNWMCNVWAWDHVFNAVALAYGNPKEAWRQWSVEFLMQDESGLLPDTVNNSVLNWNYCKPPVQGWALQRMMRVMELSIEQMHFAYHGLRKLTEWWLNWRDHDGDGLCEYTHGFDSGWDNATCFRKDPLVESPDLQAYLIIQMEVLAELAGKLGKQVDSAYWTEKAKTTLQAMLQHCYVNDEPVVRIAGSGEIVPGECLLPYVSILLGNRLPENIRNKMVGTLKSERFLTAHGLATENPKSELYEVDGYWRGPIWAPAMILIIDGLVSVGETEFARDLSKRFCDMIKDNGFAENFNALTGEGLRDPAYTWTPSVFLTLAHDFL